MKRVAITFCIFLFLVALGIYISVYQNPFNPSALKQIAENHQIYTDNALLNEIPSYIKNGIVWDLLDQTKFFAWVTIIALTLTSLVSAIHLLIDKLFFRKFFEQPALFPAIRRGLWFGLTLVGIIFLRLIDGLYWYNIASIAFLFLCLEFLIVNIASHNKK